MNTNSAPKELEAIQRMDMAAEWVLLLRQEPVKDEHIAAWLQWCEADARNQHAFERAQKLLGLTRQLAPHDILGDEAGEEPAAAVAEPVAAHAAHPSRSQPRVHAGTPRRVSWALRLGVAAVAVAAVVLYATRTPHDVSTTQRTVVTATDPLQTTQLPDGSRIELGARTQVAVDYSERLRSLQLDDGEAYFSVAPNKQRPFVVAAGRVRVRAVGTAFNVRRAGDRVVVTVTQGKVDVYRADAADGREPVHVAAGGQLVWNEDREQPPTVASVNPAMALAWREGRLEYAGEPLEAVIADLNRYSRVPIVIEDATVKQLHFTGTVLTRSTEEWLRALPGNFPVQLREQDGKFILAARRAPQRG